MVTVKKAKDTEQRILRTASAWVRCRGRGVVRNKAGGVGGQYRPHPEGPSLCCWELGLHPVGNVEPRKCFKLRSSMIKFTLNDLSSDGGLA